MLVELNYSISSAAISFNYVTFILFASATAFGDTFAAIGVREPQPRASEAFRQFGDYHRQMEKYGIMMLRTVKPVSSNFKHTELI